MNDYMDTYDQPDVSAGAWRAGLGRGDRMIANDAAPFCYTRAPEPNDPSRAGQRAGRPVRFGAFRRFRVEPVHTRLGILAWCAYDAERSEEDGSPLRLFVSLGLEDAQAYFRDLKRRAPHMFDERLSGGDEEG